MNATTGTKLKYLRMHVFDASGQPYEELQKTEASSYIREVALRAAKR